MIAILLALAVAQSGAAADERFTGTWRPISASLREPEEIEERRFAGGRFFEGKDQTKGITADSHYHQLAKSYCESVALRIIDHRHLMVSCRRNGALDYSIRYEVAPNGRQLTTITSILQPGKPTSVIRKKQERVGLPPTSGNLVTGRWRTFGRTLPEDGSLDQRFHWESDTFASQNAEGDGYRAVVAGPPVPISGATAEGGKASVTVASPDTIVEHDWYDGVVAATITMRMMPDGQAIAVTVDSVKTGFVSSYTLRRVR